MRGREGKGPPSTDLLVCFPTRAHLSLMPKPICSPARPSDSSSGPRHHHRLKRLGPASPATWARAKTNDKNADISEPTSPKVTCAGQIKVRTKPNSCKNWQSVMEEIERMHNHRKQKKRAPWIEALGFKKEVMQFLTCLRNIRFDFRCFGSIPTADITSDDDEEDDDGGGGAGAGAVFSKWFMILQENNDLSKEEKRNVIDEEEEEVAAAPENALLLMRCRSAPAKSWLEEREEEEREREKGEECEELIDDELGIEGKRKEEVDFCEFAVEIAKENWMQERICRSRSWKR